MSCFPSAVKYTGSSERTNKGNVALKTIITSFCDIFSLVKKLTLKSYQEVSLGVIRVKYGESNIELKLCLDDIDRAHLTLQA